MQKFLAGLIIMYFLVASIAIAVLVLDVNHKRERCNDHAMILVHEPGLGGEYYCVKAVKLK